MEILHAILQQIVPIIVFVLEMMGVLIVFWTCLKSFGEYIQNTFMKKHNAIQTHLAKGLATGLEFKLGAEILCMINFCQQTGFICIVIWTSTN